MRWYRSRRIEKVERGCCESGPVIKWLAKTGSRLICRHISQRSEKRERVQVWEWEGRRGETEIRSTQPCGSTDWLISGLLMSGALPGQAAPSQSPQPSQQELPYTAIHTFLSLPRTRWQWSSELTTHTHTLTLFFPIQLFLLFISGTMNVWLRATHY